MPRPLPLVAAAALALAASSVAASTAPQRLTVYSGGFEAISQSRSGAVQAGHALVQRPITVRSGELVLDDLPLLLDPSTVRLAGDGVRVRGQRYDFAGLDQAQLLQRAVGRTITVEQNLVSGLREHTGTLVAVGNGLTLREANGQLRVLAGYSGFTLAEVPEGLVARPTLRLAIETSGERAAVLDYATAGLAWRAEYRADLRGEGRDCRMRLEGHAMVANRSGVGFENVALSLVAGDPVQHLDSVMVSGGRSAAAPMEAKMMMADAAPVRTASGDNHRYTLPGTGDLPDGSLQRLPLLDAASNLPCERRYDARRDDGGWMPERPMLQRELGGDGEVPVASRLVFSNDRAGGLGLPLPAGRIRSFLDGELLGEAMIAHTAAGRRVELELGRAFDLSSERRSVGFALDRAGRSVTETIEWTLRNGKDSAATVNVTDRLPRWTDWQLIEGAATFRKIDAQRIEANARVPAGGETVLRYTVRYRWADDITID